MPQEMFAGNLLWSHTQHGITSTVEAWHITFSIRIRSPHSASSTLSIIIKSSLVIFHCLLAKWTTAKSLPYWPAAIILFTFCTTSVGKQQGRNQWRKTQQRVKSCSKLIQPHCSPTKTPIFWESLSKDQQQRCFLWYVSLPFVNLMTYLYFSCWQTHAYVNT